MSDFVYTTVVGKISEFFEKLREIRVPPKATSNWLLSIGFKSSNDRSLLTVLKFIGFTDNDGIPTEAWSKYRGKDYEKVMASSILKGYDELFQVYQDAYKRTSDELVDFFRTRTNAGDQVVRKTVGTFQNLCELADFSRIDQTPDQDGSEPKESIERPELKKKGQYGNQFGLDPSVHIDIQIHIPPDASPDQIEAIFKNMAKYLFDREIK